MNVEVLEEIYKLGFSDGEESKLVAGGLSRINSANMNCAIYKGCLKFTLTDEGKIDRAKIALFNRNNNVNSYRKYIKREHSIEYKTVYNRTSKLYVTTIYGWSSSSQISYYSENKEDSILLAIYTINKRLISKH
jgi:hypothetical protein